MKKIITTACAAMTVLTLLTACGSDELPAQAQQSEEALIPDDAEIASAQETMEAVEKIIDDSGSDEKPDPVTVHIYYIKNSFDDFSVEVTKLDELTPENLVRKLAKHNILPWDTDVESFEADPDNEGVIKLTLSKEYKEYLGTMSEDAANAIESCVADTFLYAYDADSITINGGEPLTMRNAPTE